VVSTSIPDTPVGSNALLRAIDETRLPTELPEQLTANVANARVGGSWSAPAR